MNADNVKIPKSPWNFNGKIRCWSIPSRVKYLSIFNRDDIRVLKNETAFWSYTALVKVRCRHKKPTWLGLEKDHGLGVKWQSLQLFHETEPHSAPKVRLTGNLPPGFHRGLGRMPTTSASKAPFFILFPVNAERSLKKYENPFKDEGLWVMRAKSWPWFLSEMESIS